MPLLKLPEQKSLIDQIYSLIRLILLLSFLRLSTFPSTAQISNKLTLAFLAEFSNTTSDSPFIYSKGLNTNVIKAISKHIEREEMFNNRKYEASKIIVFDTLILTKEEKQYILNELKKQSDTNLWNQLKIPNSKLIPLDTLTAISNDTTKGWNYFSKVYGKTLFNFSIPIFFRNNQYCIFYYNTTCGIKCGEEVCAIFKRKKNDWSKWITIFESDVPYIN